LKGLADHSVSRGIIMKQIRLFLVLAALAGALASASAAGPMDEVRSTADRVVACLRDPSLQGDARKAERRQRLRAELDSRFDWDGIARGCLGRHWSDRSRDEQKEFVRLFGRLLAETYLDKTEPYYRDLDRIDYKGEKIIEGYASVRTVVNTKEGVEHPVEYRLQKSASDGNWRVYDVVIEGVSLVRNYREQFDEIIAKASYGKLFEDLRSKVGAIGQ
jgi:phospholipid transport system substrate-binding protein